MMTKLEIYLNEYSESHQNKINIIIHKICVPLIMFSSFGILKAFPVPETWPLWLDWSTFAAVFVLGFYGTLKNLKVFTAMLIFIALQIIILEFLRPHFFVLSLFLFLISWIFQFIGHKLEGKKPSFFKDLFFLLIGPIWVIKFLINNAKDIS